MSDLLTRYRQVCGPYDALKAKAARLENIPDFSGVISRANKGPCQQVKSTVPGEKVIFRFEERPALDARDAFLVELITLLKEDAYVRNIIR